MPAPSISPETYAATFRRAHLEVRAAELAGRDGRLSRTEAARDPRVLDAFEATGSARPSVSSVLAAGELRALERGRAAAGTDGKLSAAEHARLAVDWQVDLAAFGAGPAPALRHSASVLKSVLAAHGLTDAAALLEAARAHDNGNRYLSRPELEAAARSLAQPRTEVGIISDLDKTIIPHHTYGGPMPTPYPGVAALFRALELGADGKGAPGDLTYVTARSDDRVVDVPGYLSAHGLPAGPIETGGASTAPWVAQAEKVRDITRVLEANPGQKFVFFGDTSHRDPEVYREVMRLFPDQVLGVFIHQVTATVNPARTEGMHVFGNYAEVAGALLRQGTLDERTARDVVAAARAEGLSLTDAQVEALLGD